MIWLAGIIRRISDFTLRAIAILLILPSMLRVGQNTARYGRSLGIKWTAADFQNPTMMLHPLFKDDLQRIDKIWRALGGGGVIRIRGRHR